MYLTEAERDLVNRLRRLSPVRRRRLVEEADATRHTERLEHLRRTVALWPRSKRETEDLLAELDAARRVEE